MLIKFTIKKKKKTILIKHSFCFKILLFNHYLIAVKETVMTKKINNFYSSLI